MVQSKIKKLVLVFLFIIVLLMNFGQSTVNAVVNESTTIQYTQERYIEDSNGVFQKKKQYKIKNNDDASTIRQLGKYSGTQLQATNYYCLKSGLGVTTYTSGYDMVSEKSAIEALSEVYNGTVDSRIYTQIMWILDHMYVHGYSPSLTQVLNSAGIVYRESRWYDGIECWEYSTEGNKWFYGQQEGYFLSDPVTNQKVDVVLSQEEVEAVQQAALWYFTNYVIGGEDKYNVYMDSPTGTKGEANWLNYTEDTYDDSITGAEDANKIIKEMKQEQAAILANYLIESANQAKTDNYVSPSAATTTLSIDYTTSEKINEEGTNYVIGPMKITATDNVNNLSITVKTGEGYNTTINPSNVTLRNSSGTTISSVRTNEVFYVVVPKTSVDESVKVIVNGSASYTTKTLWTTTGDYQPVVEVERETVDLDDELTATPEVIKLFDLALRKQIIRVNSGTTLLNENGLDATRTININKSTIPDTATYNHRKDPIVVEKGDKVTYRIYIYNEGEIDGYASKIVDVLASGLKMSTTMGTSITSRKGNTYTVSNSGNTITLTLTGTATSISAYETELDYDYVDVICEVEQNPGTDGTTKHYLSNIAYIEEAKDKDGTVVTQDRNGTESIPGNTNTTNGSKGLNVTNKNDVYHGSTNKNIFNETNNNSDYFAGQEDDDDFETVVVLPKEFDLKLVKYIAEVNGTPSNRTITVDKSELNTVVGGKKVTTADYQVTKIPVTVETGDIVKYTIRIYNEADVDGYAEEITEDIPEGLEYITTPTTTAEQEAKDFNDSMLWTIGTQTGGVVKTVKTSYLSRANNATDNLIKAYDGNTLSFKEVSIMLKVISTDVTKVIRNEAEISNDKDKDGNDVIDRDSTPEEWKKENSDDYYDGPEYPKYKEDDEDYDNIKLVRFDLALRKFISSVSTDGDFENTSTTTSYNRAPQVDVSKLNSTDTSGNLITTAIYNHSKEPIVLDVNNYVLYTIRVYNEGDIDGYAKEITDYLPTYLDFVDGTTFSSINSKWTYDAATRKVTTDALSTRKLAAFKNRTELDYADVQIVCKVNDTAIATKKITNIAEISQYADEDGDRDIDIDSTCDNLVYPTDESTYKDTEIERGDTYIPGQEDDDDFEKVVIRGPGKYDVILIKEDESGVQLNSKATFEVNGVSKEVTGYLVVADDVEINASNVDTPDVYVIKETVPPDDYCEFSGIITITANKKTSANSYVLDNLDYVVKDEDGNIIDTTDATVYLRDGNIYVEVKDHKENFDLALRKFITDISGKEVTTRIPQVSYENGKITYTHPKDVITVKVGDIVTYTLRVFNEGQIDGFAQTVTDDIPEFLEFLPDHATNREYRWVMYDQDGNVTTNVANAVKIVSDYTSKENGEALMAADSSLTENPNYLTEFDPNAPISNTNPDYVDLKVAFKVKDPKSSTYVIVNKAQISEDADEDGNPIDDIDSIPDVWNEGEDDQDYENIKVEYFDLALRKFITDISGKEVTTRIPQVSYENGKITYTHPKDVITVKVGDVVTYTLRVFNEGAIDGFAQTVTDDIPEFLEFLPDHATNREYRWVMYDQDGNVTTNVANAVKIVSDYTSKENGEALMAADSSLTENPNYLNAFDPNAPISNTNPDYVDLKVAFKVKDPKSSTYVIVNKAQISEDADEDGNPIDDIDSIPDVWNEGEDDQDYENIKVEYFDLALRKFITEISGKGVTTRIPQVSYENGKITYTHPKDVITVKVGDIVTYTLRVYNEGQIDGYAEKISDDIPEFLEYLPENETNREYRWVMLDKDGNETNDVKSAVRVMTDYTSKEVGGEGNLLKAFDPNAEISDTNPAHLDVKIAFKVKDPKSDSYVIINKAQISEDADEDGNPVDDIDSIPDKWNDGEDDQDYENIKVKYFDLALRKYITEIAGKEVTTRIPQVSYENGKITYTHPKDVIKVHVDDVVIYTLRVFNEGQIDGYAEKISDDIPEFLEYLPENETNKEYRWVMLDKDGNETNDVKDAVKVMTDYTSKEVGGEKNLLKAFDPNAEISDKNPAHLDVKIAFKVKDPNSNTYVIINKAQISEDADEDGNPVDDIDSIPDKWNDGEDDQDYENVSVEYFDLALLKYVTKVIVTDNGKTKTISTGNTGADTDIIPKVEINKKRIKTTVVKFEYTIKITNEGDVAGYCKEITDYVPKGLKFYAADNTGWKDEGNNVISTKLLENTLLQPGQSATVKVVLRWINGESNLQTKINTAEISEDDNDRDLPDRDSTPDNQKTGEDDIDDAPVLLTIKTGLTENVMLWIGGVLVILVVLGTGIILIKKYVL